jgi:uncharacterized membrane protein YebE (DUF533 family)
MGFNAQGLLNQMLSSGQAALRENARRGRHGAPRARSTNRGADDLLSQFGGLSGRTAAGSALAMLLGSRRRRRAGGGGILSHGGAAALGALAYRAYMEWQAQQRTGAGEARTLDRVPEAEAEAQSRAVLTAVVAAAKADGHIDDSERAAIEAEFDKLDNDPEARRWLVQELSKPLDPAEVARAADSDVVASEMYLASRLVVDTENFMERAYLDELARCMHLDKELQARLDREADGA